MTKCFHAFSFVTLIVAMIYFVGISFFALFTKPAIQVEIVTSMPMIIALSLLFISLPGLIHWSFTVNRSSRKTN